MRWGGGGELISSSSFVVMWLKRVGGKVAFARCKGSGRHLAIEHTTL